MAHVNIGGPVVASIAPDARNIWPNHSPKKKKKKRKVQSMREQGNLRAFAPIELMEQDLRELVLTVLTGPIRILFTEAIVLFSCLYTGVIYAIFYSE